MRYAWGSRTIGAGTAALVTLVAACLAWAAPARVAEDVHDQARLSLTAQPSGDVVVSLSLLRNPPDGPALCEGLDRLLPVRLDRISRFDFDSKLYAIGHQALTRDGVRMAGEVDFVPLCEALADQGFDVLTVLVRQPASAEPTRAPSPVRLEWRRNDWIGFEFETAHPPEPWQWSAGFTPRDQARIGAALALLLLLPIGALIAIRQRALADRVSDPATLWFRHARQSGAITLGALFGWPVGVQALGAAHLADWWVPASLSFYQPAIVTWIYIVPPALVMFIATALGHGVSVRARGVEWTLREMLYQTALQLAAILVPITMVSLAIMLITRGLFFGAVILVGFGFIAALILSQLHRRAADLMPLALTTGPLRDKIFELAARGRVKLRQIYVMPMRRARLANAFAVRGGVVLLTDVLLQNLSRREVDAVMAHEVSHLRYAHPQRLALAFTGVIMAVMLGVAGDGARGAWPWLGVALIPAVVILFALYRHYERVADAGAVELTADPEAMIVALAKLGRLNLVPNEWGRWSGAFLTHPSTGWRARAIGRKAGLAEARITELLAGAELDPDRYEMPATLVSGKVFSTPYKLGTAGRTAWLVITVSALTPALWVAAARATGLLEPFGWATALAGVLLTFCALLLTIDRAAVWPYRALRRRLAERLRDEGVESARTSGVFVGLSPGSEPRVFEGFYDWDVGYLFLTPDRLVYLGEEARFELARTDVEDIVIGPGAPGWIRTTRLYLRWSATDGTHGTLQLRPASVRAISEGTAAARRLHGTLRAWQRGEAASAVAGTSSTAASAIAGLAIPALGAPRIGEVTSVSPPAVASPRAVGLGVTLTALFAVIAGMLVAGGALAVFYGVFVSCVAQIALFVPIWRYRSAPVSEPTLDARQAA